MVAPSAYGVGVVSVSALVFGEASASASTAVKNSRCCAHASRRDLSRGLDRELSHLGRALDDLATGTGGCDRQSKEDA